MITTLFGLKKGQTQTFTEDGMRLPVTRIQMSPTYITGINTNDGFTAIQLGFGENRKLKKAAAGHIKKAGLEGKKLRFFRSIRATEPSSDLTLGKEIAVSDILVAGDKIMVTGVSKGKGFAGVVKRHGFAGGPKTHGQSDRERAPGSIGQTTTPGRVYRGKRMAGRMGSDVVTVKGLSVVSYDPESRVMEVKGLVPGGVNSILKIEKV